MPFAAWLGQLFVGILAYFGQFLGKRLTIVAASITVLIAIMGTFKVAVDAALNTLVSTVPTGAFLFGLGLLPSNTSFVISAIISAHASAILYVFYRNIIAFRLTG